VPEDLRDYTGITETIASAFESALRSRGSGGNDPRVNPGAGGNATGTSGSYGGSTEPGGGMSRALQAARNRSVYRRGLDKLGTTSADSVPIPLLVLAGLGGALLLSAGALSAGKHLRERAEGRQPSRTGPRKFISMRRKRDSR
jgi:hypothetical protein